MHQSKKAITKKLLLFFFFILLNGFTNVTLAQNQDKKLYINTKKGKSYVCTIIEKNEEKILIKDNRDRRIPILIKDIRSVEEVNPLRYNFNSYWPVQRQSILQNATPNAFNMKEGEIHILNAYAFFNQINIGLTDRLSVASGYGLIGLFDDTHSVVWVAPKYTLPPLTKNIRLGFGTYFFSNYENHVRRNPDYFGFPYTVLTFGNPDFNFSFAIGVPFNIDGWEEDRLHTFSFSARLGKRTYLRSENYIFRYDNEIDYTVTFVGLKNIWTRFSMDYGVLMSIEPGYGTYLIPAPFFTFTYSFPNAPSNIHLID